MKHFSKFYLLVSKDKDSAVKWCSQGAQNSATRSQKQETISLSYEKVLKIQMTTEITCLNGTPVLWCLWAKQIVPDSLKGKRADKIIIPT